jgi:hypothetical protein
MLAHAIALPLDIHRLETPHIRDTRAHAADQTGSGAIHVPRSARSSEHSNRSVCTVA